MLVNFSWRSSSKFIFSGFSRVTLEVVALESSGNKRKNFSVEDKAAALQQKGMEMQAEGGPHEGLITKYSAAAREYAKNGFINMGLWTRSEQELKLAHQNANEGVVKKQRKTVNPGSSDGGAGFPTTGPNCLKHDTTQQIHRNFMCWGSVPADLGVH